MQSSPLAEIIASLSEADSIATLPLKDRPAAMMAQHWTLRESLRSLLAHCDGIEKDRTEMRTLLRSLRGCVREYRSVPGVNGQWSGAWWSLKPGYGEAVRAVFGRVVDYLAEKDRVQ